MKEISLNILDITENSVKAGASLTEITIEENEQTLTLTIKDDGCGMSEETVMAVSNPFYTTRTTRKVGLGIPLLKLAAEQTGGYVEIHSRKADEKSSEHGTLVQAVFYTKHLDCPPLGDIISTLTTLIQGHPDTDFHFLHKKDNLSAELDTRELRTVLEDIPLNTYDVILWIKQNLEEQYAAF